MKRFMFALFAAVVGLGMFAFEAEAKRLGGGKSFGFQRDSGMQRNAAPAPAAPAQAAPGRAAQQPGGASRWLGPIAGLAAGIGLAALLSHFGLGEGFASFLMLALLVMAGIFVFRLLFRRAAPASRPLQYAGAGPQAAYAPPAAAMPAGGSDTLARIPAGFDAEGFLRQAKLNFVRLQAANDAGNVTDLREFTTPELFAELRLQLQERGAAAQQTDVVTLEADLLDVSEETTRYVASVRFHGSIREEAGGAPQAFDEVWHLVKPVDGSTGWVIAGIQQVN